MIKKLALILIAIFAVIQVIPAVPPVSNPPFDKSRAFEAAMAPPQEVTAILRRACYDCHSNETVWPWYSHVAPVSWMIRRHVVDGRKQLNFSEWLLPGEKAFADWSTLEGVCTEIRTGRMPIPGYVTLHAEAVLNDSDTTTVCNWIDARSSKR